MRRLLSTARSYLTHFGQTLALLGMATLAMAAAPHALPVGAETDAADAVAQPTELEIRAEVEPAGPPMKLLLFAAPIRGHAINSNFGRRHLKGEPGPRPHQGVDIAAPAGTAVLASAEGVVTRTGYDRGYGHHIEVRHPNGLRSFYAHLSRVDVRTGAWVEGGQRIGGVGSTGYSTGPHLHFEVRQGGRKLNPIHYIGREFAVELKGGSRQG